MKSSHFPQCFNKHDFQGEERRPSSLAQAEADGEPQALQRHDFNKPEWPSN